jgi:mono/diheme cytochrome c family protein
MGGWATTSVHDLPDHAVAGQPMNLVFTVRQHGETPLADLSPRIEATAGTQRITTTAKPGSKTGVYAATLTFPRAADWTVTIHSGFGNQKLTLMPLQAVDPSTSPRALSLADRGHRLFAAKGCVGCHVHGAVNPEEKTLGAPDLTTRQLPADYLAKFLRDPSVKTVWATGWKMPNQHLSDAEVAAIVAFLSAKAR